MHRPKAILPLLLVLIFVTACGDLRPFNPYVAGLSSFDESKTARLEKALSFVNENSGTQLTATEIAARNDGYPIYFQTMKADPQNPQRAGLATIDDRGCTVELLETLFTDRNEKTLLVVVAHEFGHCAGLLHDPKKGEIMSATAGPLSNYSSEAITRFFSIIHSTIGK